MKNKGITLIALVITIIVMLILVAVTITIAVNGGLFNYASNAVKDTEFAKNAEKDLATLDDNMTTEDLIAKYTGAWHSTADGKLTNGKYTVEIGDYINYNCYNGTEYSESGFTVTSSSNSLKWRVLGTENGNLLILSEKSLGALVLRGADGYNNGINMLNTICEIYGHGQNAISARSIKIEDVNKLTGYNPMTAENGNPYGYNTVNQYKNGPVTYEKTASNITYTYGNNQTGTYGNSSTPLRNIGATENSTTLTIPESTFYIYECNIISNDEAKYDLLFGEGTGEDHGGGYWLASAQVKAWLESNAYAGVSWGLNMVVPGVYVGGLSMFNSGAGEHEIHNMGVRAVVFLSSDIKLKQAETSNTWDFD